MNKTIVMLLSLSTVGTTLPMLRTMRIVPTTIPSVISSTGLFTKPQQLLAHTMPRRWNHQQPSLEDQLNAINTQIINCGREVTSATMMIREAQHKEAAAKIAYETAQEKTKAIKATQEPILVSAAITLGRFYPHLTDITNSLIKQVQSTHDQQITQNMSDKK